jgi:hypothetical protein
MGVAEIQIIRGDDDALLSGLLYSGLRAVDLTLIERQWSPWRQNIVRQLSDRCIDPSDWPQSLHWDWFAKLRYLQVMEVEVSAIDLEGEWQAVVMLEVATHSCHLEGQAGKPLVYIEYIETAPWNWPIPELGLSRRYKGLGHILFRHVVRRSFQLGYQGRVGLVALPQAKKFYQSILKMTHISDETSFGDLSYFELTEARALEFINEET